MDDIDYIPGNIEFAVMDLQQLIEDEIGAKRMTRQDVFALMEFQEFLNELYVHDIMGDD
jgi:hypothetical protein